MPEPTNREALARWQLVLGKYARARMPDCLSGTQQRMAASLEQLCSREYRGRGVRQDKKLGPDRSIRRSNSLIGWARCSYALKVPELSQVYPLD